MPLYLILGSLLRRQPDGTGLRAAVAVNLVSHPTLWFVLYPLARKVLGDTGALLVGEALVVVIETVGLRRLLDEPWLDAAPRATVANAASLVAGLTIYSFVR